MKCNACAKDEVEPMSIDWADCPKHYAAEDMLHHRLLRIGTIVAVSVGVAAIFIGCVVVPAVMLYG